MRTRRNRRSTRIYWSPVIIADEIVQWNIYILLFLVWQVDLDHWSRLVPLVWVLHMSFTGGFIKLWGGPPAIVLATPDSVVVGPTASKSIIGGYSIFIGSFEPSVKVINFIVSDQNYTARTTFSFLLCLYNAAQLSLKKGRPINWIGGRELLITWCLFVCIRIHSNWLYRNSLLNKLKQRMIKLTQWINPINLDYKT